MLCAVIIAMMFVIMLCAVIILIKLCAAILIFIMLCAVIDTMMFFIFTIIIMCAAITMMPCEPTNPKEPERRPSRGANRAVHV